MRGHCCHCAKDCGARIGMGNFIHNNFRSGASWIDEHCPACAELAKKAAELAAIAESLLATGDLAGWGHFTEAARIVRRAL